MRSPRCASRFRQVHIHLSIHHLHPSTRISEEQKDEASRLDAVYGTLSPRDCGEIPTDWFDKLDNSFFHSYNGPLRSREEVVRELRGVHLQRLGNWEGRKWVWEEARRREEVNEGERYVL